MSNFLLKYFVFRNLEDISSQLTSSQVYVIMEDVYDELGDPYLGREVSRFFFTELYLNVTSSTFLEVSKT